MSNILLLMALPMVPLTPNGTEVYVTTMTTFSPNPIIVLRRQLIIVIVSKSRFIQGRMLQIDVHKSWLMMKNLRVPETSSLRTLVKSLTSSKILLITDSVVENFRITRRLKSSPRSFVVIWTS